MSSKAKNQAFKIKINNLNQRIYKRNWNKWINQNSLSWLTKNRGMKRPCSGQRAQQDEAPGLGKANAKVSALISRDSGWSIAWTIIPRDDISSSPGQCVVLDQRTSIPPVRSSKASKSQACIPRTSSRWFAFKQYEELISKRTENVVYVE